MRLGVPGFCIMRIVIIIVLLFLPIYRNCIIDNYNYRHDEKRYCSPTVISGNGNALIGSCATIYKRANYWSAHPQNATGDNNFFKGIKDCPNNVSL